MINIGYLLPLIGLILYAIWYGIIQKQGFEFPLFLMACYGIFLIVLIIVTHRQKASESVDISKVRKLCDKKKFDKAWGYLGRQMKKFPQNPTIYNEMGYTLVTAGKASEALPFFDAAIELYPENAAYFNNKSWACNELKQYDEALDYSDRAISMDSEDYLAFINKGNALVGLERLYEAMDCYEKALEINSQCSLGYYGKGVVHFTQEDYDQALVSFNIYLKFCPNDIDAYFFMAKCLSHKGEFEEQVKIYDKILSQNKKLPLVYICKGDALCYLARFGEALKTFDKAIELDPQYAEAYYHKCRIFAFFRHKEAAIVSLKAAVERDERYKQIAWEDESLNNIKIFSEFKQLVMEDSGAATSDSAEI